MRPLTLLQCLLMVATLRWIIGSTEALTPTEQKEAALLKTHVTLEAVNTGFKASLVAASIRTEDCVLIAHELLSGAIDAGARSTKVGPLPIESTSRVRIHRNRGKQVDQTLASDLA
jgi:hypothetical protein